MAEALEWFQCKDCGRRQRWAAEWAGKKMTCSCGAKVVCPTGPQSEDTSLGDTLIESADAPTTTSTWSQIVERETKVAPRAGRRAAYPGAITAAAARTANKKFLTWSILLLVGISMLIHVAILWPQKHTYWPFWIYVGGAVLLAPLAFFKFKNWKRRWQRGRPFMDAFASALGSDSEE